MTNEQMSKWFGTFGIFGSFGTFGLLVHWLIGSLIWRIDGCSGGRDYGTNP